MTKSDQAALAKLKALAERLNSPLFAALYLLLKGKS